MVKVQRTGLSAREVIQSLLGLPDLDVPFLIYSPPDESEVEDAEREEGIVLGPDDTVAVIYVTETNEGVVVSADLIKQS